MKNFEDYRESKMLENLEYRGIDEAIILLDDIKVPSCYIARFAKSVRALYGIEFYTIYTNQFEQKGIFMGHEYSNQQIATLRRKS